MKITIENLADRIAGKTEQVLPNDTRIRFVGDKGEDYTVGFKEGILMVYKRDTHTDPFGTITIVPRQSNCIELH